ncbi:MAG: T9SS type A sorting domain-containing protein, partial [Chlorobi bacterium]|nr:T9SS type A sorting domain-containing protein [Chlorobiota bacterium]
KIDAMGNILWDRIVGGNMLDQVWTGTATSDGGVVALGWTGSNDGDVSNWYGLYDIWMVKLNSEGTIVADKSLGTSSFDWGVAIVETNDGGFLLGGGSGIGTGGNIICEPYGSDYSDAVLFKLDVDLNIEWQRCYGGTDDDVVSGMLEVEDGYILLIGTYSNDGDVSGWHGGSDIWVVKIDFDGNILWQNCLGGSFNESSQIIFRLGNDNIMIIGSTESQDGDVVGNHSQSEYSNDIWLVKLNGEGDLLWQQCIGGLGNEETRFGAIKKSDTDFVIAGQFNKGPSFDVGCVPFGLYADMPDVWLFEVKDTTTFVTDYEAFPENKLKVYPNPARDYVLFESKKVPFSGKITIMDVFGKEVKRLKVKAKKTVWDTREVRSGVYFYRVEIEGETVSGKIVVQ